MCEENRAKAHAELNQICFRVDLVPMHTEGPICLVQFLELLFNNPIFSPVRSEAFFIWHYKTKRLEYHDVFILL